jgi:hypothetical protein
MTGMSEAEWRKSSRCSNSNCVEVAFLDNEVAVRDSKDKRGGILRFTSIEWKSFLDRARSGEFDVVHLATPDTATALKLNSAVSAFLLVTALYCCTLWLLR